MKLYALLLLSAVALVGCGEELSSYRYPCQDPDNFLTENCKPPVCELDGTCTKYLIDEKIVKTQKR